MVYITKRFINKKLGGTALTSESIDTTTTLGDSDTKVPSQKAVKVYVDSVSGGGGGGVKKAMSIAATF